MIFGWSTKEDWIGLVLAFIPPLVFLFAGNYMDSVMEFVSYSIVRFVLGLGICMAAGSLGITAMKIVRDRVTVIRATAILVAIGFLVWSIPYGIGVLEAIFSSRE